MSNAGGYASYMKEEAEVGQWVGEGARELGLAGEVGLREFGVLRGGVDPKTGEALRQELGDRVYQKPWGEKIHKSRELYEFTVSAPKSVSLQAIVDPKLLEAHQQGVDQVLRDLEHVTQGQLVMATWQHRVSRAGDPQLHTHIAVMNVAHDERGWHALQAHELFLNQRALTGAYRATLLGEIERQGYQIEYPEIAGIPVELRDKYSRRSEQIDERIEAYRQARGKEPTPNVVQALVLDSRPEKDPRTAREIMEEQYARLEPGERVALVALATEANHRVRPYVAHSIQAQFGGPLECKQERQHHPHLVIHDGAPGEGSAQEPEWTYGQKHSGPRIGF